MYSSAIVSMIDSSIIDIQMSIVNARIEQGILKTMGHGKGRS